MKCLHYGWIIVAIAFGILAIHAFVIYTFGVFLRPLTMEFNWDRGALSGAVSVFWLVIGPLSIFTGRLSDKYGPRILVIIGGLLDGIGFLLMSQVSSLWQVYLIWGLLIGGGSGFCYVPVTSTIPRWFDNYRGLALGLTVAGFGLGGIISAPLTQWLISSYGWQQAFIILGLITLIITIPLALFMKHSPQQIGLKPYGEDSTVEDKESSAPATGGLPLNQVLKSGSFWVFGLLIFCFFFCLAVINAHIVPHTIDIGISEMVAATIISIISAISIIGRLSMGFISDRIGARLALSISLTLATLALICLLFAQEILMFYLFAVVFGLASGGLATVQVMVTAECFGLKSLGIILGCIGLFNIVGAALGAPLAGSIFDATKSYSLAFLICVIISALSIILSLILLKAKTWRTA